MMVENKSHKLIQAFNDLKNTYCIDSSWGISTGSVLKMTFSSHKKMEESIHNLSMKSELMLYSAWRIRSSKKVNYSWRDIGVRDAELDKAIKHLSASKVIDINYDSNSHDFTLKFEDTSTLSVFCDISNDDESEDNYILFGKSEILSVDHNGVVQIESYERH